MAALPQPRSSVRAPFGRPARETAFSIVAGETGLQMSIAA